MGKSKCKLIGNTRWGYCCTPLPCNSIKEAREYGREMVDEGYWHAYRIIRKSA